MTVSEFTKNHVIYNKAGEPRAHSLAILNAAPGSECMYMCGLFRVPMSSGMMRNGLDDEYVSFIANEYGASSYWIHDMPPKNSYIRTIYYPEIEEIIDDIFGEFPEFAEQMPGRMKEEFDSNKLYEALGMDTNG